MTRSFVKAKSVPGRVNSSIAHSRMVAAMLSEPKSSSELTAVGGMHYQTTRIFLSALHREGAIHIAAWEKNVAGDHRTAKSGKAPTGWHPLYLIGGLPDAPKPAAATYEKRLESQRNARRAAALLRGPLPKKNPGPKPGAKPKPKPAVRVLEPQPLPQQPWGPSVATRLVGNLWGTSQ